MARVALLALSALGAAAQPQWRIVASNTAGARTGGSAVTTNSQVLVIGGRDPTGTVNLNVSSYTNTTSLLRDDGPANQWMPERAAVVQAPDNRLWAIGGTNAAGVTVNTVNVFDPLTRLWTTVNTTGGVPAARRNAAVAYSTACDSSGTIHCIVMFGGLIGTAPTDEFWVLYPNELPPRWVSPPQARSGIPSARHSVTASVSVDQRSIYFFGGVTAAGVTNDMFAIAMDGFPDATSAEMINNLVGKSAAEFDSDPTWSFVRAGVPASLTGPLQAIDGITDSNFNGVANSIAFNATLGINVPTGSSGSTNNRCTHSYFMSDPWWRGDMINASRIDAITIFPRQDCCGDRYRGWRLFVSNVTGPNVGWWSNPAIREITTNVGVLMIEPITVRFPTPIIARYVWVMLPGPARILTLCEVQAFERRPWVWRQLSGSANVALRKPAWQTSTEVCCAGGDPNRAVDGITTNNYNAQPFSCSHTAGNVGPGNQVYWQVDLLRQFDVTQIRLWARTDCCTARNTRWELYIGNSQDFAFNTRCAGVPADVSSASVIVNCVARGRYIHVRRPAIAGDDNILSICELQAFANLLLDQPPARVSAATTTFGGYLIFFGGSDAAGYRLNDVRMWDLVNAQWVPTLRTLGFPPSARAFSILAPVVITAPTGTTPYQPNNVLLVAGGSSNSDTLSDAYTLSFPACPPLSLTGVSTSRCIQGGTVCFFTCLANFRASNGDSPVVCRTDGYWDGITPVCAGAVPTVPQNINVNLVTPTPANVSVQWTAPASFGSYTAATDYRVSARTADFVETFQGNDYQFPNEWTVLPVPEIRGNVNFFRNGMLHMEAAPGSDYWWDPFVNAAGMEPVTSWDIRTGLTIYRNFPSNIDVNGAWSFETYMETEATSDNCISGIGVVDMGLRLNTTINGLFTSIQGWLQFYFGTRYSGGVQTVNLESVGGRKVWRTNARSSKFWVRIERWPYTSSVNGWVCQNNALLNYTCPFNGPIAGQSFRTYYKYRVQDPWIRIPMDLVNADLRTVANAVNVGGFRPANMRLAFHCKNWNAAVFVKTPCRFTHIRVAPLECAPAVPVRRVTPSTFTTFMQGFTNGGNYVFEVAANSAGGYGAIGASAPLAIPTPVPTAAPALIDAALRRPVTMSSMYCDSVCYVGGLAVDGDDNTYAHTNNGGYTDNSVGANPGGLPQWITVDLGVSSAVKAITILNRCDSALLADRLNGFSLHVGDSTYFMENAMVLLPNVTWRIPTTTPATACRVTYPYVGQGRYVSIRVPNGFAHIKTMNVMVPNACPARPAGTLFGTEEVIGLGRSCGANTPWGVQCVQRCQAGYVRVAGEFTSTCNGEAWDVPQLTCAPICPDLAVPAYAGSCRQVLVSNAFSATTDLARFRSLDWTQPLAQPPAASTWFVADGVLQASARIGCFSDLMAVSTEERFRALDGNSRFTVEADISTSDRAGLAFRIVDGRNHYRLVLDVISRVHVLERVVDSIATTLTDATMVMYPDVVYRVVVSVDAAVMNVTINGRPLMTTSDRQFTSGYVGMYARSTASFDNFAATIPCVGEGACRNSIGGDTCGFTCGDGLTALGPATRTCVQTLGAAAWSPDLTTSFVCTVPPPTFTGGVRSVAENSPRGTIVGDPLVAITATAEFQLNWLIEDAWPAGSRDQWTIDSCSGQIKVSRAALDFETLNVYTVQVRAYIQEFSGAATVRNVTINVLNVDEPPIIFFTDLNVTENSPANTVVGWPRFYEPENDTLTWSIAVDTAARIFTIAPATGQIRINATWPGVTNAALNYEATTYFDIVVQAVQNSNTAFVATSTIRISLLDANDAPVISTGQTLRVPELNATVGSAVGVPASFDEDRGAFTSNLTYGILSPAVAQTRCGINTRFPTVNGLVGGTPLFEMDPVVPGGLRWAAIASVEWRFMTAFPFNAELSRAVYSVCYNVTDGFGAFDLRAVNVSVVAAIQNQPVIATVSNATLPTTGGPIVFSGTGFSPSGPVRTWRAWITNGAVRYNATGCAVTTTDIAITCTVPPGVGANFVWTLTMDDVPVLAMTGTVPFAYDAPVIASLNGGVDIPTSGGRQIIISGSNFGPTGTPVFLEYATANGGLTYAYTCSNGSESHTVVRCTLGEGAGRSHAWRMTVGGQQIVEGSRTLSYAAPNITSLSNATAGYSASALNSAGGQDLVLVGNNFGPAGTTLVVTYGGPSGNLLTFSNCRRGAGLLSHTQMTCTTVAGVGASHSIAVTVQAVPAASVFLWNGVGISYAVPVISRLYGPGASNGDTAGGVTFFLDGTHFGPIVWAGGNQVALTYGRPGDFGRYSAACRVTSEPPAASTITCTTAPGVGAGHWLSLNIAGQTPAVAAYGNQTLSYAPPQIISFAGPGAASANTEGSESVTITGANFGPADAYTSATLRVSYLAPVAGPAPLTNVTFDAGSCTITVPHKAITCTTAEGAGKDLEWRVIVDGQVSTTPTTNYAAPVIYDILEASTLLPVTAANVDGGTVVLIRGAFFGPQRYRNASSLIQSVTYGPSGSEYVVQRGNWTLLNHTGIRVVLGPGAGVNLYFRISVADQVSATPTLPAAMFSYALPRVEGLSPQTADTFSDPRTPTIVTVRTRNLPLRDPASRITLTFGQGATALALSPIVPQGPIAIAAATNPDASVNVSFALPKDGAGVQLAVRVNVQAATASSGVQVTSAVWPGALFSYNDPVITDVIVTRALFIGPNTTATSTDVVPCPFPTGNALWSCTDPSVIQLTLLGSSFTQDPALVDRQDGVTRALETLASNDSFIGEVWTNRRIWLYSWSHTRIVAFTTQAAGVLRLSLTSTTWNQTTAVQAVRRDYFNLNPQVSAIGGSYVNVPSTGSTTPAFITVLNLAGATGLVVTVGGTPATIVTESGAAVTNVRTQVIDPQSNAWTVYFMVPPGQGAAQPIQVLRLLGSQSDPSNTGFSVSYAAPTLSQVAILLAGASTPVITNVGQFAAVAVAPTDGSARVQVIGANLGVAPTIVIGDGFRLSGAAVTPCAGRSAHTCYEAAVPAGEGTGANFAEYAATGGYRIVVDAGGQISAGAQFKYDSPVVTAITSSTGTFPTRGGVSIGVTGRNFGVRRDGRPDSVVMVEFGRLTDSFFTPCVNVVRTSHTVINCTLPEGSGRDLAVQVTIADIARNTTSVFSYAAPIVVSMERGIPNDTVVTFPTPTASPLPPSASPSVGATTRTPSPSAARGTPSPSSTGVPAVTASPPPSGIASRNPTPSVAPTAVTPAPSNSGAPPSSAASPSAAAASPSSLATATSTGARRRAVADAPRALQTTRVLNGPTTGGDIITLRGSNFGAWDARVHCAFLTSTYRSVVTPRAHACNGGEDWLGEGEVDASLVLYWDHEMVIFRTPPGVGARDVELSIRGAMLGLPTATALRFNYDPPRILSMTPATGGTEGGDLIEITGLNFGPTPRNTSNPAFTLASGVFDPPVPLADAPALPLTFMAIAFTRGDYRACVSSALTAVGSRPGVTSACSFDVRVHTHNRIVFAAPAGVGRNRSVTVEIFDGPGKTASNVIPFTYLPPQIVTVSGDLLFFVVLTGADEPVTVQGANFGNRALADLQGWTAEERQLSVDIGGVSCVSTDRSRVTNDITGKEETVITCMADGARTTAGARNMTVFVAGQSGFRPHWVNPALIVACGPNYYGRVNETCIECPAQDPNPVRRGAECRGYLRGVPDFEKRFSYPRPLAGFYNLNGSEFESCPDVYKTGDYTKHALRKVCIVPCDPPTSCRGDNVCADGYASKAPMYRCASCAPQFYKRAGECIRCPDSPAGLFIGFIALILVVAGGAFILNSKGINVAVLAIGVDFFQVLAIFNQSRIAWPPAVRDLLHVLSAFNLNIEIVAPECLIPDVQYKQKFAFIMLLPACVFALFLGIWALVAFYKASVLSRRSGKRWATHWPVFLSSALVLMYILYLYETRTMLDVFNCAPTVPSDGKSYLQVVFEECYVAGLTQQTLAPWAAIGLALYTFGYPAFVGAVIYRYREIVMEDQLLRAKGVGNDRLTNPHALTVRKAFSRSYFQFRPDYCLWILVIIFRKFCIAASSILFNRNPAFQMAACLLIMFVAYALQVAWMPYMSPSDFDKTLKEHIEASYTNAIHARLRTVITNIETRGRKTVHKNLMTFDGKIDRAAVLGIMGNWFFNYNTVEGILLFAAVIVCLMGIMYQANSLEPYYPDARDSITSVVLIVIIVSIIYFFVVVVVEAVSLYYEDQRMKALKKRAEGRTSKRDLDGTPEKPGKGGKSASKRSLTGNTIVNGQEQTFQTGNLDLSMNPIMMAGASTGNATTAGSSAYDAIMTHSQPPPMDLWRMFQTSYGELAQRAELLATELAADKQKLQRYEQGGAADTPDEDMPTKAARTKKDFTPQAAASTRAATSVAATAMAAQPRSNPLNLKSARRGFEGGRVES